jgi:Protein of unknown function DUF262
MIDSQLSPVEIKLEGIGHVLRDKRLRVPPYQRGYSWESEEVSEFWWDLRAAFGTLNPQYFLGTIVLTDEGKGGHRTIIDGQQRLTTTSLLFIALRNEFLRRGDVDRAQVIERDYGISLDLRTGKRVTRLRLNTEDQSSYESAIEANPGNAPHESASRILAAITFLEQQIASEAKQAGPHWAETMFRWVEFIEHQVRVITVTVASESDAFLIFETLNARGRELTVADLLKSYLFGLSGDSMQRMQQHWDAALRSLETTANEEIFTTYLRHLWSSMNGATRERELYGKIKAAITAKPPVLSFGEHIEVAAPLYAALLSTEQPYWATDDRLRPLAETLLRLGLEQNRPLLLAAMRRFLPDELMLLLRAAICWSVRGLVVGGIGGGKTERAYAEAAVAITEGRATDTEAVFRELTEVIPTDDAFQQAFAARRINRTTIAKYLLVSLARMEQGVRDPLVVPDVLESSFRFGLQLPRNASPSDWPHFSPDEIPQWSSRLGNLFVIGSDSSGIASLERAPIGDMLAEHRWSPQDIAARQEVMAERAVLLWTRRP